MKYDVFISYSRDDKALVLPFVKQINKAVMRDCWIDLKGIESGVEFEEVIMKAIDECQIVLFMLSDNSLKSKWTKREVYYAEDEGKRIVPVLIDGEKLRGWFKFHFGNVDYIDIRSEEQKQKLIRNLRDWLGVEEAERKAEEEANLKTKYAKNVAEIHINVDADCHLFRFNEYVSQLKSDEDNVIYLNPGKHRLEFVSTQYFNVRKSMLYSLASNITCDFIEVMLKGEVEERTKTREVEEEAKKEAEEKEHQKKLKLLENTKLECIEEGGKHGFADESGKVVIPCKWRNTDSFSEGLALVQNDNEKYGFIDKTGKVVIPCKWRYALPFSEDLAKVEDGGGKWWTIDKAGKVVEEISDKGSFLFMPL